MCETEEYSVIGTEELFIDIVQSHTHSQTHINSIINLYIYVCACGHARTPVQHNLNWGLSTGLRIVVANLVCNITSV